MSVKKTYGEKLNDPRWQKRRLRIFEHDNWTCTLCGCSDLTLHVHHEQYAGEPWESAEEHLKTVCAACHAFIECVKPAGVSVTSSTYLHNRHKEGERLYAVTTLKESTGQKSLILAYFSDAIEHSVILMGKELDTVMNIMQDIQSHNG